MYDMLKNMDPPLGFGNKCPNRLAYKKLIRMNMPMDADGKVNFTTTLFALIRENLSIKMRTGELAACKGATTSSKSHETSKFSG
jgi:voltage-dependent calcium channel N type alpha-1B